MLCPDVLEVGGLASALTSGLHSPSLASTPRRCSSMTVVVRRTEAQGRVQVHRPPLRVSSAPLEHSQSVRLIPFFLTLTSAGISSESPNESRPVFLTLAVLQNTDSLLRLCSSLLLLEILLRLNLCLLLRLSLRCGDTRHNVVKGVLDDTNPSDLWWDQRSLFRVNVEIGNVEDV